MNKIRTPENVYQEISPAFKVFSMIGISPYDMSKRNSGVKRLNVAIIGFHLVVLVGSTVWFLWNTHRLVQTTMFLSAGYKCTYLIAIFACIFTVIHQLFTKKRAEKFFEILCEFDEEVSGRFQRIEV